MAYRRRVIYYCLVPLLLLFAATLVFSVYLNRSYFVSQGPDLDPPAIEKLVGLPGKFNGGSFKVVLKRPGLSTTIDGVRITPEMGLMAWLTLTGTQKSAVLLGDIPLREQEVAGVLRAVVNAGVMVTSLHNRFMMDSDRIMSLHLEAFGTQNFLAAAMGQILAVLSSKDLSPPRKRLPVAMNPADSRLDEKEMENLLWKGKLSNGVFRVSVGRGTQLEGQELGEPTGVRSWAAFAGSDSHAVVNGDIATLEFELPFVLKDLIGAQIQITSIHTHLTQEKPKLVFVHFWGEGPLTSLATGVKAAIWEKERFQSQ